MTSRPEATTARFFEALYAIVVGLGLTFAVEQVVDLERSGFPIAFVHLPLFLAYVNVAFPLAHASVRYLDLAYVERALGAWDRTRAVSDLGLGTGQFLFLIALALLVTRPVAFGVLAIILLVGRPVRDGLLRLTTRPTLDFDRTSAVVHLATIAAFVVVLVAGRIAGEGETVARWGLFATSYIFPFGMYLAGFSFFFPGDDAT